MSNKRIGDLSSVTENKYREARNSNYLIRGNESEISMVDALFTLTDDFTQSTIANAPTIIGHTSNTAISNIEVTRIDATDNICKKCIVTANENNTGWIRFGGSGVSSTTGIILHAGESYTIEIANTNLLYAVAEILNETVSVTYFN